MDKKIWVDVPDNVIRHIWHAPQDNDEQAIVTPDWYEQNGTPMSEDGEDMVYSNTQLLMNPVDAQKLAVIAASFQQSNMFYTPTSKEDAEKWIEHMSKRGTGISIGFMVGLNYAAEMIKQIIDGTHPALTPRYDPDADVPIPAHDAKPPLETSDIPASEIEEGDPDDDCANS